MANNPFTPQQHLDTLLNFHKNIQALEGEQRAKAMELAKGLAVPDMRLVDFVRQAWHVLEPETPYLHNWHIDAICQHLEACTYSIVRNLIVNIAPRHMKSLLVAVFWPCWVWTFMPHKQWLFFSYAASLSTRDSLKRRRVISSDWYQQRYGDVFSFSKDQRRKNWFDNNKGGHMIASGLSGVGLSADFAVGDDLLDGRKAYSPAYRLAANQFWSQTVATRANNPKEAVRVLINQRLHFDDVTGFVMEQEKEGGAVYDKLILPTEFVPAQRSSTSIGWTDPRQNEGDLIWPERFPADEVERLKISLGSSMASSQLQQRPSAIEGTIINRLWLRTWSPVGTSYKPMITAIGQKPFEHYNAYLPDKFDEVMISWDCSFKDSAASDYVAGGVWGRVGANYYLLDNVRRKMDFVATLGEIERLATKWPQAVRKLIEEKANGAAVIQTLRSKVNGLIPINPTSSKSSRLHAVAPLFEAGNVYVPHPSYASWVKGYIEELCDFPYATHDDQVDQTTQILNYWQKHKSWTR